MTSTEPAGLSEVLAKHRSPDPSLVSKLPRVTCADCRAERSKVCSKHQKAKCDACGNYITSAHMHLDYVGHADVTTVLIQIDPGWTWEPVAWTDAGAPSTVEHGGTVEMWGRLTLLGVTRIGVGSCEKGKPEVGKELVGDFLRNAAMRFGIFVDLWSKSEASSAQVEPDSPRSSAGRGGQQQTRREPPQEPRSPGPVGADPQERANGGGTGSSVKPSRQQMGMLHALLSGQGIHTDEDRHNYATATLGRDVTTYTDLSVAEASALIDSLKASAQ